MDTAPAFGSLRRNHFSVQEEDRLWELVIAKLKAKPNVNPLSGSFWRETKKESEELHRSVSTYTKKFGRMWNRQEVTRLESADLDFLKSKMDLVVMKSEEASTRESSPSLPGPVHPKSVVETAVQSSLTGLKHVRSESPEMSSCSSSTSSAQPPELEPAGLQNTSPEFLLLLSQMLEERDPDLMRSWTDVCARVTNLIEELMTENGMADNVINQMCHDNRTLTQTQNVISLSDESPARVSRKRKLYSSDEERKQAQLERKTMYNEKRKLMRKQKSDERKSRNLVPIHEEIVL